METVTKIVDGQLKPRKQKIVTIGDGQIVTYRLSEHEFETLGEGRNRDTYLGVTSVCVGIIAPLLIDVFTLDHSSLRFTLSCCMIALCAGVGAFTFREYRLKRKDAIETYIRLKRESEQILERCKTQ